MRTIRSISVPAAALAASALLGSGLSGCSVKVETNTTPSVSSAALQKNLSDRLTQAGNPAQSVTCNGDLVGEVGKTATCEVVMGEANIVNAIATVTKVEGDTVNFDLAPELTKEQLEKALTGMASAESVSCEAGLAGEPGATTMCTITKDGNTSENTVKVTKIEGLLMMDLSVN